MCVSNLSHHRHALFQNNECTIESNGRLNKTGGLSPNEFSSSCFKFLVALACDDCSWVAWEVFFGVWHLLRSREPFGEIASDGRRETALVDQRQPRLREAAGRRVADHNDHRGTAGRCVLFLSLLSPTTHFNILSLLMRWIAKYNSLFFSLFVVD